MKAYAKEATIRNTKAEIQDHITTNAFSPAIVITADRTTSNNALYRIKRLIT